MVKPCTHWLQNRTRYLINAYSIFYVITLRRKYLISMQICRIETKPQAYTSCKQYTRGLALLSQQLICIGMCDNPLLSVSTICNRHTLGGNPKFWRESRTTTSARRVPTKTNRQRRKRRTYKIAGALSKDTQGCGRTDAISGAVFITHTNVHHVQPTANRKPLEFARRKPTHLRSPVKRPSRRPREHTFWSCLQSRLEFGPRQLL